MGRHCYQHGGCELWTHFLAEKVFKVKQKTGTTWGLSSSLRMPLNVIPSRLMVVVTSGHVWGTPGDCKSTFLLRAGLHLLFFLPEAQHSVWHTDDSRNSNNPGSPTQNHISQGHVLEAIRSEVPRNHNQPQLDFVFKGNTDFQRCLMIL